MVEKFERILIGDSSFCNLFDAQSTEPCTSQVTFPTSVFEILSAAEPSQKEVNMTVDNS